MYATITDMVTALHVDTNEWRQHIHDHKTSFLPVFIVSLLVKIGLRATRDVLLILWILLPTIPFFKPWSLMMDGGGWWVMDRSLFGLVEATVDIIDGSWSGVGCWGMRIVHCIVVMMIRTRMNVITPLLVLRDTFFDSFDSSCFSAMPRVW